MSKKEEIRYDGKIAIVVDDDVDMITQISFYLEGVGFKVLSAESQKDGEKLIEENDYDLAIFDLMMENQDSGFILSYKSKKKNNQIPVILVTAVTSETGIQFDSTTDEARNWVKADALLNKDIRQEQLIYEINRLMDI